MTASTRSIKKVLATVRYEGANLEKLKAGFAGAEFIHLAPTDTDGIAEAIRSVDVAILASDLDKRFLAAPNLKWVHCDHAGLNGSAKPEVISSGMIVTGSAGRAAQALAQHIFYFALGLVYDAPGLERMKHSKVWRGEVDFTNRRGLIGKTMGIIGYGYTGEETAKLANALGMRVLAHRKRITETPEGVEKLYCADRGEGIDEILKQSDLVVLTMRLNDATYRMIDTRELGLMKKSAFLINMARGAVVNEAALVTALKNGTIAGAGLDVFEQEPLPAEAAIWDAPNLMLTPHATAEVPDLAGNSLAIILDNINRYREGRAMRNQLVAEDVYSH